MKKTKQAQKVAVVGIGNLLLKDEGIGIHVVEILKKANLSKEVELIDGATLGLDLLYLMEGKDKVIIVDAIDANAKPGTIFKFSPQDIKDKEKTKLSLHQVGLLEVLELNEVRSERTPEIVVFGIQPQEIDWGMEPTPLIQEKIPKLVNLVIEELG